jgi:lipocalin
MKELTTVPGVDINRYAGKWYEIARFPHSFEKDLICVYAEYGIRDDGKISVTNSGRKISDPAKEKRITGKAWIPDPAEPGRLKVQFFWPFAGGYYIFHLDQENYQYALVGTPSRKYFWLLARTREIDDRLYEELVEVARRNDFPVDNIERVRQDCE